MAEEEEGEGETGGAEMTAAWRRSFCDGGGGCSTERLVVGGPMVLPGCIRHRPADDDGEEPRYYPPPAVAAQWRRLFALTSSAGLAFGCP